MPEEICTILNLKAQPEAALHRAWERECYFHSLVRIRRLERCIDPGFLIYIDHNLLFIGREPPALPHERGSARWESAF